MPQERKRPAVVVGLRGWIGKVGGELGEPFGDPRDVLGVTPPGDEWSRPRRLVLAVVGKERLGILVVAHPERDVGLLEDEACDRRDSLCVGGDQVEQVVVDEAPERLIVRALRRGEDRVSDCSRPAEIDRCRCEGPDLVEEGVGFELLEAPPGGIVVLVDVGVAVRIRELGSAEAEQEHAPVVRGRVGIPHRVDRPELEPCRLRHRAEHLGHRAGQVAGQFEADLAVVKGVFELPVHHDVELQ